MAQLDEVKAALRTVWPELPESIIEGAALAATMETGVPPKPLQRAVISSESGCWLRAGPDGPKVGMLHVQTQVWAGAPEDGWTPVELHGYWIGASVVQAERVETERD